MKIITIDGRKWAVVPSEALNTVLSNFTYDETRPEWRREYAEAAWLTVDDYARGSGA